MIKDGLWDAYNNYHMGTTAENISDIWGITRKEHGRVRRLPPSRRPRPPRRPASSTTEIVPVPVKVKKEIVEFKVDEYPPCRRDRRGHRQAEGRLPRGPRVPQSPGCPHL